MPLRPAFACKELARELPQEHDAAILVLVQRYWSFMLEQPQIYRLMHGMDGVTIDRERADSIAWGSFDSAKAVLQSWFVAEGVLTADVDALLETSGLSCMAWLRFISIVLPNSDSSALNTAFSHC